MKLGLYIEQGSFEILLKLKFIIVELYQSLRQNLEIFDKEVKNFIIFYTSSVKFHIHINKGIFEISLELEFIIFGLYNFLRAKHHQKACGYTIFFLAK